MHRRAPFLLATLFSIAAILVLESCSNTTQSLANACEVAAGAVNTATTLRAAGTLSTTEQSNVTIAVQLINPICGNANPPITVTTAINVVTEEAVVIAGIATAHAGGK